MIFSIAGLPCPTFGEDHIIVRLKQIPRIVGVAPRAATDKPVTFTIVHLAGEPVGIRAIVGVEVAVMVRVTVHNIVIGAVRAVVLADAKPCICKLMSEAELDSRVQIIGELASLDAVVRTLQLDAIIRSMHDVQSEQDPVVAGDEQPAVAYVLGLAVAVEQLLLEVEDRPFVLIGGDDDWCFGCAGLFEAQREFVVCTTP